MVTFSDLPSVVELERSIFIRGNISASEILDFIQSWKGLALLQTCRTLKNGVFELTFRSKESADLFEDLGFSFSIGDKKVEQRPADPLRKKLRITGLPGSFKEDVLLKFLSEFGSVESLQPELFSDYADISTGVYIAVLYSKEKPPPLLRMGDFTARISQVGQRYFCWDCQSHDHGSGKCPAPKCRNCLQPGHLEAACTFPCASCSKTHSETHNCFKSKLHKLIAVTSSPSANNSSADIAASPGDPPVPAFNSVSSSTTEETTPPTAPASTPLPLACPDSRKKKKGKRLPASSLLPDHPPPISVAAQPTPPRFIQTRSQTHSKPRSVAVSTASALQYTSIESITARMNEIEDRLRFCRPSHKDYAPLQIEFLQLETAVLEYQDDPWFEPDC